MITKKALAAQGRHKGDHEASREFFNHAEWVFKYANCVYPEMPKKGYFG